MYLYIIMNDKNNKRIIKKEFYDYGTDITSVSQYLDEINKIRFDEENLAKKIAYRGQSKEYWNIMPGIFRDGMLNNESELINESILKCPFDLDAKDRLDVLAKIQHYGMVTRLLDLTDNPLVALYFACKVHREEDYLDCENEVTREPFGCVYYLIDYPKSTKDIGVVVKSTLAMADFSGEEETLGSIIELLKKDEGVDIRMLDEWNKEEGYTKFVNLIQSNDIVKPRFTNDRIERQSGMFLLTGCYNFYKETNLLYSKIHRATCNLRDCFNKEFFYIRGENKSKILLELDMCGINEFSLFPELEHKLSYIKDSYARKQNSGEEYIKNEISDNDNKLKGKKKRIEYKKIRQIYNLLGVEDKADGLIDYIKEISKVVDWDLKESIKSSIRLRIKSDLKEINTANDASKKVNDIIGIIYNN